jgi:hypothetical protein
MISKTTLVDIIETKYGHAQPAGQPLHPGGTSDTCQTARDAAGRDRQKRTQSATLHQRRDVDFPGAVAQACDHPRRNAKLGHQRKDFLNEVGLATSVAINIPVPQGDPVFPAGTSIAMTRDTRSPVTNTIINTIAGYLDLSQLQARPSRSPPACATPTER